MFTSVLCKIVNVPHFMEKPINKPEVPLLRRTVDAVVKVSRVIRPGFQFNQVTVIYVQFILLRVSFSQTSHLHINYS